MAGTDGEALSMDDLNIIDRFTDTFVRYIDSGFGLLAGDVAFLTSVMVGLDIVLVGLFWALDGSDNVPAQLIRKVLYVGFFALLLNNFKGLADIIFQSFAGLGLKASGASLTAADLMRPGFVASTGFTASRPLLEKAGELIGITSFFTNFVTIVVLLLAWLIVLLAFFVLSVQLFITIIEFKITVLAGFVLVPFALFGQTAFLAERVLGNVISSGIKLMVLAIVVGIGSSLFGTLIRPSGEITLTQAASTILAAIAVFGLAVFVPGLAAGLVSGAPQLGAGAAVATTAASSASSFGGTLFDARLRMRPMNRGAGAKPVAFPVVADTLEATEQALSKALSQCDLVVSAGGASVGEFDLVRPAFERLNGELGFWKVAIKPGRPWINRMSGPVPVW
jgi:type IV secretion system protein TrbL